MPGKADKLPTFEPEKRYLIKGETLNQIIAAIKEAQILSVRGGQIERTPTGVHIKIK